MSEVFCFRLDPHNPREAAALEVIRAWRGKGYSIRHILTEALGTLDQGAGAPFGKLNQVNEKLDDLFDLLRSAKESRGGDPVSEEKTEPSQDLSAHFLASIKEAVKPGLRME